MGFIADQMQNGCHCMWYIVSINIHNDWDEEEHYGWHLVV